MAEMGEPLLAVPLGPIPLTVPELNRNQYLFHCDIICRGWY